MDICVDRAEHVYPMQVPGGSMRELWLNKSEKT
jgi:acetolactate synthase-1/2/3 large subunit